MPIAIAVSIAKNPIIIKVAFDLLISITSFEYHIIFLTPTYCIIFIKFQQRGSMFPNYTKVWYDTGSIGKYEQSGFRKNMAREKKNLQKGYIETFDSSNTPILAKRQTFFFSDLQIEFLRVLGYELKTTKNSLIQLALDMLIKEFPDAYKSAEENVKKEFQG